MSLFIADIAGDHGHGTAADEVESYFDAGEIRRAGSGGSLPERNPRAHLPACSLPTVRGPVSSRRANEPPVMIVDDDSDWRTLTQHLLKKEGIANPVVAVASAEGAKSYLRACCPSAGGRRSAKPAVILLDINMPGQSGFEVLKWIREKRAFRRTKVIMWSASEDENDRERAVQLKADAYLVKLSMGPIVAAAVRACFAKRALERAGVEGSA